MAMGKKAVLEVELHPDSIEMLEYAQETYGFRSTSKALRVILDYVATDADWEQIFLNQRCLRCGAGKGWDCLLYTSPSPRDRSVSRMPSSA